MSNILWIFKMSNHYSREYTGRLPVIPKNWKSGNNTKENLIAGLKSMSESPEYRRIFNPETGKLVIWYMMSDDNGCKITLWNTRGSCTIEIKYFCLDETIGSVTHTFHPHAFSSSVNHYLLKEEDLAEQRRLITQEQERKDALKKAHDSSPRTCGGVFRCEYCKSDAQWHQQFYGYGT
jgi:hypothetical protein